MDQPIFSDTKKKWGMEIGNQVGLGTLLLDVLGIGPSTNQDLYFRNSDV